MTEDLAERVAELERRVAALEGRSAESVPDGPQGIVGYQGELSDPELSWEIRLSPPAVLALPDGPRVEVLSALANADRVALVRLLARDGPQTGAALRAAAELGSPGRLYHHLKALTAAGLVEQDRRGSYRLRATATIPALVLLTAAADVAGQLRPGVRGPGG
ncbi:ArsR/SmtB family transcription factor [Amycolatopsis jiangsuensis]|uniref:DNA-binding transcriptional ArsR family regulator n=1 Tax=Amycolatopsis jiangsuensis TaxID=1181879 RepID=A0A840IW90_9PSEU|nr:helix-turn-helix domain-containing protein [Amycolatopsis jiangsuensis]MBB4685174.1 DNA-binding transcriptional ArsR family regulator [Amycolatopsis jiangsuensis]